MQNKSYINLKYKIIMKRTVSYITNLCSFYANIIRILYDLFWFYPNPSVFIHFYLIFRGLYNPIVFSTFISLKVKIEILEKTCGNYQQGIKEMNKSFGYQQQCDEMASMQTFKEIMQQLQKTNVQLETERIDLQVKCARHKEDADQLQVEKDNLNKKFLNADQTSQRLQAERAEFEANYRRQLELKNAELAEMTGNFLSLSQNYEALQAENRELLIVKAQYEQLVEANQQLTQHYEELYAQAADIVNGNQLLNQQVQECTSQIESYESQFNDYNMQIDHLQSCNSELNTKKINLDMKVQDMEEKLAQAHVDLREIGQASLFNIQRKLPYTQNFVGFPNNR